MLYLLFKLQTLPPSLSYRKHMLSCYYLIVLFIFIFFTLYYLVVPFIVTFHVSTHHMKMHGILCVHILVYILYGMY